MSVLKNQKILRVERSKSVEGDGSQRGSVDFFFFPSCVHKACFHSGAHLSENRPWAIFKRFSAGWTRHYRKKRCINTDTLVKAIQGNYCVRNNGNTYVTQLVRKDDLTFPVKPLPSFHWRKDSSVGETTQSQKMEVITLKRQNPWMKLNSDGEKVRTLIRWWERCDKQECGRVEACGCTASSAKQTTPALLSVQQHTQNQSQLRSQLLRPGSLFKRENQTKIFLVELTNFL